MLACRRRTHLDETGRNVGRTWIATFTLTPPCAVQRCECPDKKPSADLEHEDDFKQELSDENGLADTTVPWVTVRSKDVVGALDFLDVNSPAGNRVETIPFRHVSFAENVETVEFDPAIHGALSSVIENNASAPNMAYRAHAASAPTAEYDATLMMAHQAHATPAPWLSTTLHRLGRTGYVRHLLLWLNTTPMLHKRFLLLWWTGQSSRSCMSLRCR